MLPRPPLESKHSCIYELPSERRDEYLDEMYLTTPPFIKFGQDSDSNSDLINFETHCPVLASQIASSSTSEKFCYAGWTCRFLGGHVRRVEDDQGEDGTGLELLGADLDEEQNAKEEDGGEGRRNAPDELNWHPVSLLKTVRTRKYPLPLTKAVLAILEREKQNIFEEQGANPHTLARGPICIDVEEAERAISKKEPPAKVDIDDMDAMINEGAAARLEDAQHSTTLIDTARVKPSEKRRLDWFHDELYLAPLTTTGNLPFRRLCSSLGALGLSERFLQGQKNEWSLVRRWEGERCFGTQLCGNKPDLLVPAAEMLAKEFATGLDFIDVNCGCPIDLVYNRGAGSALLDHANKLGRIVRGMSAVTGDIPITIKLRTGTTSTLTTHKFFPRIKTDWTASGVTLHGRSRQQRYKNLADWNYIRTCADALRESIRVNNEERPDEEWVHPIPIYGNGDVNSWQDYEQNKDLSGVDGQMLARGALIKPWLFTEIKERRDWDISSRERLDLIRQLASYGLTHWGSDTQGVNTTRRFVCDSLSFTHRYIPVGILEHVPVKLNERPPPFKGRDELETLLASGNAKDWVKITDMFLGKAPDEFNFIRECGGEAKGGLWWAENTDTTTLYSKTQVQLLRRRWCRESRLGLNMSL
jgi:tRNA-dihydrouridine synthase 3